MSMVSLYTLVFAPLLFFFGKYMIYLFVHEDVAQIIPYTDYYVKCISFFLIALAVLIIFRHGLQGIGYAFIPLLSSVAELVTRCVVAGIGGARGDYHTICYAGPVAWAVGAAMLLIVYFIITRHPKYRMPT